MQRLKDKEMKKKHKLVRHYKHDDKNPKTRVPKKIRTRKELRFQVPGTNLKYCKSIPLTQEIKRIFGRRVFQIIPPEMKRPGYVPFLSMYLDKKNRTIVWRVDLVEHEDILTTDENGKPILVPNEEYKK